jgi:hypothetical protein
MNAPVRLCAIKKALGESQVKGKLPVCPLLAACAFTAHPCADFYSNNAFRVGIFQERFGSTPLLLSFSISFTSGETYAEEIKKRPLRVFFLFPHIP